MDSPRQGFVITFLLAASRPRDHRLIAALESRVADEALMRVHRPPGRCSRSTGCHVAQRPLPSPGGVFRPWDKAQVQRKRTVPVAHGRRARADIAFDCVDFALNIVPQLLKRAALSILLIKSHP